MFTNVSIYQQLLTEYEYLFEEQEERGRSVHADVTSKPKW
jgi:hypothetical protein